MKKFLSIFLVLTILITCVACGKTEPTNADSTTTTESTTESTTKDESTTESVSEDESTTVVEESTTKAQNEEETTKKNDTTTTNKSESTTKKTETTTKKTETTTKKPSANTTTTTTKPSASKPYFVSLEIVSIKRVQNFYVDGMHVLDRIYGKNKCLQYGDTLELRVNMSDGGSSGFKVVQVSAGTYTVKGNIISITINQRDPAIMIDVLTVDKNGKQIYGTKEIDIHDSSIISDDTAIRSYAEARGLQLLNGTNEEDFVHYKVKIPGNSNWHSQAFVAIDKCVNAGCTRYTYQIVPQDAFEIGAYK